MQHRFKTATLIKTLSNFLKGKILESSTFEAYKNINLDFSIILLKEIFIFQANLPDYIFLIKRKSLVQNFLLKYVIHKLISK